MIVYPTDIRRNNYSQVKGLKRGVVTDLNDPEKLNRVKVTFIDEDLETPFADVMAKFAGEQFGTVFVPSKGEEVLVGFLDGQINNPVILGSLYNSKKKPPLVVNEKNEIMMLQFPAGLKIEINNLKDKQKITIITKKGHTVSIDDGAKEEVLIKEKSGKTSFGIDFKKGIIDLKADKKISMSAGGDMLVLEGNKGLALKSNAGKFTVDVNSVAVKAKADLVNQAGAKAVLKGNANAVVQASGPAMVKGAMVKIN